MSSALDRLHYPQNMMPEVSNYSPDEQIQSATEDDAQFLLGMSQGAQQSFYNAVQEVTLDDDEGEEASEPVEPVSEPEKTKENELFNNNKKPRKTYTKKQDSSVGEWDGLLNQLSKEIIKDLIEKKYTAWNLDSATTKKILGYMYKKF